MKKRIVLTLIFCVFSFPLFSIEDVSVIDIKKAKELIEKGAVLIDNRPEHKYSDGHIKNAVNLPFFTKNDPSNKMTKENLLKAIGAKKVVVFYCTGLNRSYHAVKQAEEWGIKAEMHWYKNGFKEWKSMGNPVETQCDAKKSEVCPVF
jgi:rhodanese-related sulfurtransferase